MDSRLKIIEICKIRCNIPSQPTIKINSAIFYQDLLKCYKDNEKLLCNCYIKIRSQKLSVGVLHIFFL